MLKRLVISALALIFIGTASAQSNNHEQLIKLGKAYKQFMFRNEPPKEVIDDLDTKEKGDIKITTQFIIQTLTTKNKILSHAYLTLPGDKVLRQIYIIRAINLNVRRENQMDNDKLIDSLATAEIPRLELIDRYYGILFTGVGNKNQPFNLSAINLTLDKYQLENETEKAILFLRCMELCGSNIWGYMNVVKPPNTQKAYAGIKSFPKFNGSPYYQYGDLYFPDFEINILQDKGLQSYKTYYLNKYYETLLSHLICLDKEGASEKERNDLLIGSILKEKELYKYTKHKETLEKIFQPVEK